MELSQPEARLDRPKAIIFDWDNTLVDSWPVIHDALNTTLTAFGHSPWSLSDTRRWVRKSMRDSFPGLFGERWQEASDVFYERYEAIHADMIRPVEGAELMLRTIHSFDVYQGVVSNKRGDFLRLESDQLGWNGYFGRLVGATDAKRDKPAADPVEMALDGSGERPGEQVWFVGDADIDMECAYNAGCTPVLLRKEKPAPDEFSAFPPRRQFASCDALCKSLRNL